MPHLTPNEKRTRANAFVKKWQNETREEAEAKSFWDDFFQIFGLERYQIARYEYNIARQNRASGFIDVFWAGHLLCEHKSAKKDLNKAEEQAMGYIDELRRRSPEDVPPRVIICDFARFRLLNLDTDERLEFSIQELPDFIVKKRAFDFMDGIQHHLKTEEEAANIQAAEAMGELYKALAADHGNSHELKLFLIRLLFCFFADDSRIFEPNQFENYLRQYTAVDGSDLGAKLNELFSVLNTPFEQRPARMNEDLKAFEYINGNLFGDNLPLFYFDSELRAKLLDCSHRDWQFISPEIFGSLFQSVMDSQERREAGAHYTEKANILKLIKPLFLDELRAEFQKVKKKQADLQKFYKKISNLRFLDPACGCGNFLIVAFDELRQLEDDIIDALYFKKNDNFALDYGVTVQCHLSQFHGIELDEFPSQIAKVAMWLVNHQCNLRTHDRFGESVTAVSVPLTDEAHIVNDNALSVDWAEVDYIFGNPPFIGKTYQTAEQKADQKRLCGEIKNFASLDYVCNWYVKAAHIMAENSNVKTAFVSTNSICQGEQVPVLWGHLLKQGVAIDFAYRTFQWTSSAKGKAAVHCVIVGFSVSVVDCDTSAVELVETTCASTSSASAPTKRLFTTDASGEISEKICQHINPYLIDAPNVIIDKAKKVISGEAEMVYGNKPTDGGNLLMNTEEMQTLVQKEPLAKKYIRPFLGADEFINGKERWCLWFADVPEVLLNQDLQKMPQVAQRIEKVRQMRLASPKVATQKGAETAHLFDEIRQPTSGNYLIIPSVSSETRQFILIDYVESQVINSNANFSLPNATLYHFGILCSTMHNAFMRTVAGRLESRYRYSNTIVYNNFPFPFSFEERQGGNAHLAKHIAAIETAAQAILDARDFYRQQAADYNQKIANGDAKGDPIAPPSLADFYRTNSHWDKLHQAHTALDKAVDTAYGYQGNPNDEERVAFLFGRMG
ncbi:N-6 DNA methylase [[Haemophilus] felis]|uniref:site-specific DNA-methyltransferase (adenine-specific) n=1 Tax=[Haemophilus] felis TaxID=123822 RepID=A0A1T0BC21_9PAST|nr:N-6 DNA methylase [[Haemophilus] felis]OOS07675.1 methylase [[Haemophilus] felis]